MLALASIATHVAASEHYKIIFQKDQRVRVAAAAVGGKTDVTLLIASAPGQNAAVVERLMQEGARVLYRADDVDYIRASAPIRSVARLASLSTVWAVDVADSNGHAYWSGASAIAGSEATRRDQTSSSERTRFRRFSNLYLPARSIGALAFRTAHPTYDGRGSVIGVVDIAVPDPLYPSLRWARNLRGEQVRKIRDIRAAHEGWLSVNDQVTAVAGKFEWGGTTYTAPSNRAYRIGHNTHGGAALGVAVLWDFSSDTVWVDTNKNADFTDEQPIRDYTGTGDIGLIGVEDPATPTRDTQAFTLEIDGAGERVRINSRRHSHSDVVAHAAAGSDFFEGQGGGVAPAAQLVTIGDRIGRRDAKAPRVYPVIEGLIFAAGHPEVDVITLQYSGDHALDSARSVLAVIADRLVERFDKPIFGSASNHGPGLNSATDHAHGRRVLSIGSYVPREGWRAAYGVESAADDAIANLSARGPSEDGRFKPDLLSASGGIYPDNKTYPGALLTNGIRLPDGHAAYGPGTSYAAPTAAGAAAVLISAARQANVPYDAMRLRWALMAGARFLPHYRGHEQGAGLINVPAAWEALKQTARLVAIETEAPVRTVLSGELRMPGRGSGLYEREGWVAGQKATRDITLRRTTGPEGPVAYRLEWQGNDGTFSFAQDSSPLQLALPLHRPVTVPVIVHPRTSGLHSATLLIVDPSNQMPVHWTMAAVVAAHPLDAAHGYRAEVRDEAPWLGYRSTFLSVPEGTRALQVAVEFRGGRARVHLQDPTGLAHGSPAGANRHDLTTGLWEYTSEPGTLVVPDPMPGVWEVVVEHADLEAASAPTRAPSSLQFTLTGRVVDVQMTIAQPASGTRIIRKFEVSSASKLAAIDAQIASTPLASAFHSRPQLAEGEGPLIYGIDVPEDAERLTARVEGSSDASADVDLYLFDLTATEKDPRAEPVLRGISAGTGARESVSVNRPAAGKWKVVIDPVSIPSGRTSLAYVDLYTHHDFGRVITNRKPNPSAAHGGWSETLHVNVTKRPAAGRHLAAVVEVTSPEITTASGDQDKPKAEPSAWHVPLGGMIVPIY